MTSFHKCSSQKLLVWSVVGDRGFTYESWTGENASGVGNPDSDQAGFEAAWAGAPGTDGIPTHVNGPSNVGPTVETDTRFSVSESGQDEHRLCFHVYNDGTTPWELQDIDARAESLRVYAGCDCPASLVHERYQTGDGAPYTSRGPFITVPVGGYVKLTVLIHDPGPDFSGFNLVANEVGSEETFAPTSYQQRPIVGCVEVEHSACEPYELAEGESFKPIDIDCLDCGGAGGVSSDDVDAAIAAIEIPQPCDDLPEPEALVGSAGTGIEYSRCDHIHECPPNLPVIDFDDARPVLNGPATELANANIRRISTDRELEMSYRVRFLADADTSGWVFIQAVTPPGYQLLEFQCRGVYYQVGSQDDVADAGTTPYEEQYMGGNGVEWVAGRLYYLHFSAARKFEDVNAYAHVLARYRKIV